jgi:hypothetical protein
MKQTFPDLAEALTDGQVDQEDRPPDQAEQVGLGEQAADQRATHAAEREGHPVDGERPWALLGRELHLDEGEHLGDHQRRHRPLQHAGGDQQLDALRVPVSTDASVNPARPVRKTVLPPYRRPSRPPVISSSAKARV